MEAGGTAGERPGVAQRVPLPHLPLVFSVLASKRCRVPLPRVPPPHKNQNRWGKRRGGRSGWERRVHASCEGRDWETGAGTGFANQPFAQGDGGAKGWERERESVWVGLGLGDAVPDRKAKIGRAHV